jgi:hypothetical protein
MMRSPYDDEQLAKLLVLAASAHEAQELLTSDSNLPEQVRREADRRLARFEELSHQLR